MSLEEKNIIAVSDCHFLCVLCPTVQKITDCYKAKIHVNVSLLAFSQAIIVYERPFNDFISCLKLDELVFRELNLQPGTDPQILGTVLTVAPFYKS